MSPETISSSAPKRSASDAAISPIVPPAVAEGEDLRRRPGQGADGFRPEQHPFFARFAAGKANADGQAGPGRVDRNWLRPEINHAGPPEIALSIAGAAAVASSIAQRTSHLKLSASTAWRRMAGVSQ